MFAMKICKKCNQEKDFSFFFKDSKSKDGYQGWCKKCKSEGVVQFYTVNPEKKHKRTKEQGRTRYAENKLNFNFSRRIRQSLASDKNGATWESVVGYTLTDLKTRLESGFDNKMSWSNYGVYWHIDHIKPIDSFKINGVESDDFKECWSLSNLRALHWLENIRKGNKIEAPG